MIFYIQRVIQTCVVFLVTLLNWHVLPHTCNTNGNTYLLKLSCFQGNLCRNTNTILTQRYVFTSGNSKPKSRSTLNVFLQSVWIFVLWKQKTIDIISVHYCLYFEYHGCNCCQNRWGILYLCTDEGLIFQHHFKHLKILSLYCRI